MKRHHICKAVTLLACGLPVAASAITVNELAGKQYAVVISGTKAEGRDGTTPGFGVRYASGKVYSDGNNGLILSNFYNGLGLPFTMEEGKLALANHAMLDDRYALSSTYRVQNGIWNDNAKEYQYEIDGVAKTGYGWQFNAAKLDDWLGKRYSGEIVYDDGMKCYVADILNAQSSFTYDAFVIYDVNNENDCFLFGNMKIYFYDANATATAWLSETEEGPSYPVLLAYDDDASPTRVTILNWFDRGCTFRNGSSAPFTVNLPVADIAGDGGLTMAAGTVIGGGVVSDSYFNGITPLLKSNTFCSVRPDKSLVETYDFFAADEAGAEIKGRYYRLSGGVSHTQDYDYWLTNGGARRTKTDVDILEFYTPHLYDSRTSESTEGYHKLVITGRQGTDVTHQLDFNLFTAYKFYDWNDGETYIHVEGDVASVANAEHVESYELFMIPGYLNSVKGLYQDARAGLRGARPMSGHMMRSAMSRAAGDPGFGFTATVPSGYFGDAQDPSHRYSFFVKVNYTEDSGLSPSFAELKYKEIPTSVDTVGAARPVAYASGGSIVVRAADDVVVSVCDLAGAAIYSGAPGRVSVSPGIYIVRAGSLTQKLIVR